MPALTNPRWERFAHAIVAGICGAETLELPWSQGRAYQAAGYQAKDAGKSGGSAEAAASRLLKRVQPIARRIAEIQEEIARRKLVTIASIVDELEEARDVAKSNDQAAAMVAASTSKAKILGLQVDRTEIGKPGDFSQAQSSNDIAESLLKQAGATSITEHMRTMAIGEIERHLSALAAIAALKPSAQQA